MKKLIHLSFIGILISLIGFSCGSQKESSKTVSNKVSSTAMLVENFDQYRDSSPVTIKTLDLHENTLFLKISYSGGCEDHEFKLLGLKSVSKSKPAQREVILYHNNNNDHCRELLEHKLKIDISNFGLDNGDPVILIIQGWKNPVKYYLND